MAGYGDDSGLQAWLDSYGYTLPDTAPSLAVLRQRGSDYLDGLYAAVSAQDTGYTWSGDVSDPIEQERAWPRTGAYAGSVAISSDAIPPAVVRASYYAAYIEGSKAGSLSAMASNASRAVRKKVDTIEVQYSDPGASGDIGMDAAPVNTAIFGMVKPFLVKRSATPLLMMSIG